MRKPFTNHGHIFVPTTRAMDSRGRAIWRARLLRFIHRARGHFHLRVCQSPPHPGGGARFPSRCNAKQQGDSVNQARVCLSEIAAIYRPLHFGPMPWVLHGLCDIQPNTRTQQTPRLLSYQCLIARKSPVQQTPLGENTGFSRHHTWPGACHMAPLPVAVLRRSRQSRLVPTTLTCARCIGVFIECCECREPARRAHQPGSSRP